MKAFILYFYLSTLNLFPAFAISRDSLLKEEPDTLVKKSIKKVCTCELVLLANVDNKMETVALMAEKTSNGKTKLDYKLTAFELWKERKYLSTVFVYDIVMIEKIQEAVECQRVFEKLKLRFSKLKMHSIIDMDVRAVVMR
jgi:hypothetical protein